jgi:hypothetical protein
MLFERRSDLNAHQSRIPPNNFRPAEDFSLFSGSMYISLSAEFL